ncbi:MAG: DUF4347 domain-containing protein, partial [Pirellulales bacterium]
MKLASALYRHIAETSAVVSRLARAVRSRASQRPTRYAREMISLEERVLFSAAPIPAEFVAPPDADPAADQAPAVFESAAEQDDQATAQQHRLELVLIDPSTDDYQQLIDDLASKGKDGVEFEVVLLDGSRDGIDQISEALAGYEQVDAVHIVSHGADGRVKLGNTWLDANNLSGYAGQIALWQDALTSDADLLFYGCDLAASEDGQTLVESLSTLTGADVAASTDDTGHAIFGADWELEYTAGQIETSVAFSQNAQDNWGHLLNVAVDATSTGATTGNSLTISHMTSGTSRLMLVGVSMDAQTSASVTSVTYNGSALSLVGTIQDTGSNVRVELWQMVAPATGTHDVVVSFSQSMTEGGIAGVMTFNGVDQTTPLGSFASAQGIGTTASVNVSTDVGDLVFSTMGVDGGTDDALNHAAGQTEYWETFQPGTEGAGSTKLATSTSETMSWTFLSNQWAIGAVSVKSVANTEMQMITGSYVGDGVDGRGITGLGFDPDLVIIKQGASGQNTVARTSAMTGDVTKSFVDGIAEFANGIESLNGDGFTVGTDATVNSSGQTYYWTAFKAAAGEMSVGSYTGDGLDDRSITGVGFQADYAIVMGAGAHESVQRFQDQSGDASLEVGSSSPLANVIQAFEADGFQVGSDSRVNQSGQDYYYVAWKEVAGKTAFGTYTGDDADNRAITDVGFQPEYVLTRMEAGGDSVHRPDSLTGDNTLGIGSDGAFADGIQQYLPTGFEVGSHIIVNWSGQTYYYAAFNADANVADVNEAPTFLV